VWALFEMEAYRMEEARSDVISENISVVMDESSNEDQMRPGETVDIHELIRDVPNLWRGRGSQKSEEMESLDTGFDELNDLLPTGGWPLKSIVEIVVDDWGNGELQVLLPVMRELSQQKAYVSLVSPPFMPYAPAFHNAGIALNQLVIIDQQVSSKDKWWSAEKILRHGDCGLVMVWPNRPEANHWSGPIRRLQAAAEEGNSVGIILYRGKPVSTPASLRIKLGYCPDGIEVEILKSRYSWKQGSVTIPCSNNSEPIPEDG
jgi:cell division inhibitor SulA